MLRDDGRRAEQRAPCRRGRRCRSPTPSASRPPRRRRRRRRSAASSPDLGRRSPDVAERIVTTSPDVSVSTNLGGWINKSRRLRARRGRRTSSARTACCAGSSRRTGQHIELGISEMNLFLLLRALGLGHELHGEHAAADRHGLRPVRLPRPRRADLRALHRAPASSSSARRPASRWPPRAAPTSRRSRRRSGSSCPASRTPSRPTPARSTGCCATGWPTWPDPTAASLYLRLSTRPLDQAPVRGRRRAARRGTPCGPTCSPAATACTSPTAPAAVVLAACGAGRARGPGCGGGPADARACRRSSST